MIEISNTIPISDFRGPLAFILYEYGSHILFKYHPIIQHSCTVLYLEPILKTKSFTTRKSFKVNLLTFYSRVDKNNVFISRFKKLNCRIEWLVVIMVKISIKININCCLLSGQENKMTVCMQISLYIKINSIDRLSKLLNESSK